MKAIVLAGGLGTRLGELTRQKPKPLVDVAGRPFIEYVLAQLLLSPVDEIVFAVSHCWEQVHQLIGDEWHGVPVRYSVETEPLGTGGAIKQAMHQFNIDKAVVLNGDTLFKILPASLETFHNQHHADISVALRHVDDTGRYGRVLVDPMFRITGFLEKGINGPGLINAGVYCLNRSVLDDIEDIKFSFELDVLATYLEACKIFGMPCEGYFIDIGVPEDLDKAQTDLL